MRYTHALILGLLLAACSGDTPPPTTALSDMTELRIRATGDIETPGPMVDAGFVPNSVASWASQIILISEDGDIWRTNSDGERPLLVDKGDYKDVRGLRRENAAGVFLAIQPDGRASAFIERDDIGNFKPMTVSQGNFSLGTFCNGGGTTIVFIDAEGQLQKLSTVINDDIAIELSAEPLPGPPHPVLSCALNSENEVYAVAEKDGKLFTYRLKDETWMTYEGDIKTRNLTWVAVEGIELGLGLTPENNATTLLNGGTAHHLIIEDGLSIRGLEATSFIAGTDAALGSAYNEGMILMGDANEDRIVLLSLDYAGRVLETQATSN